VAVRLPLFFSSEALTIPELKWMIIGEKMSNDGTLYVDVWDNIAPFAAGVYWIIDLLFGRSQLVYQILSLLLVWIHCYLFNRLLIKNNALIHYNYVPALIYAVLMSLFFDFYTLSPPLLSLTFILLAINNLFSHIEFRAKRDERILNIGLYLGVASLFYLPSVLVFFSTILILALFTPTVVRRYFLIIYGFLIPFVLVIIYFFYKNALDDLGYNFIRPLFFMETTNYLDSGSLWIIVITPLVFLLISFIRLFQRARFTNYQISLLQVMFIFLILTLLTLFLIKEKSANIFILFIPGIAFFLSHYFSLIKTRIKGELTFMLFFILIILVNLGTYHDFFISARYINYQDLMVSETSWDKIVKGKKVLFVGDNVNIYKNAHLATPYLNWNLSSEILTKSNYYENVIHVKKSLEKDPPQIIIDQNRLMSNFFNRIPSMAKKYSKSSDGIKFELIVDR